MLDVKQKLKLVAIEEEITKLQLQICREGGMYLGAKKSDDEKETEVQQYIDNVIKPCLEKDELAMTVINQSVKIHLIPDPPVMMSTRRDVRNGVTTNVAGTNVLILIAFDDTKNTLDVSFIVLEPQAKKRPSDLTWISVWNTYTDYSNGFGALIDALDNAFSVFLSSIKKTPRKSLNIAKQEAEIKEEAQRRKIQDEAELNLTKAAAQAQTAAAVAEATRKATERAMAQARTAAIQNAAAQARTAVTQSTTQIYPAASSARTAGTQPPPRGAAAATTRTTATTATTRTTATTATTASPARTTAHTTATTASPSRTTATTASPSRTTASAARTSGRRS